MIPNGELVSMVRKCANTWVEGPAPRKVGVSNGYDLGPCRYDLGHAMLPGRAGQRKASHLVVVASPAIPDRGWIAVSSRTAKPHIQCLKTRRKR